ncbi:hypothetical protein [Micromonospora arborensis]|uniref:hypothetical protein n=1 Tax=Micromonospora arborensis TaxID=2116518 RepID=UPI003715F87A
MNLDWDDLAAELTADLAVAVSANSKPAPEHPPASKRPTFAVPVKPSDRDETLDAAVDEPLAEAFPRTSKVKRDAVVKEIVRRVLNLTVFEVAVIGTRMPVETVEAFGLEIGVDANGRAARVVFLDGAELESV